jgi:DNA-binding transcriptional ArsR family regulator
MHYTFHLNESRIIDLFLFPQCVNLSTIQSEEFKNSNLSEYAPPTLLEEFKTMEDALKPFEKEIHKFYYERFNIPELLMKKITLFGYQSATDYLDALEELDEMTILQSILTKLYLVIEDTDTVDDETIEKLTKDAHAQINLLDTLEADDQEKWKLSSLLRHPKATTAQWIALIKKLEPIFEGFYQSKREDIENLGHRLVTELNDTDGDAFSQLTNGVVHKSVVPSGNILVSFVECVGIQINVTSSVPYILWGLEIESFLKHMHKAKESELKERVNLYKNLGDKTRYEVIRLIAQGVESAKEIAHTLGVSQPTISYHINNLLISKVILLERIDNKYVHKVNFDQLEQAYQAMLKDFGKE